MKGETRASAPHTLQCIGDQVPLYAPGVPPVVVEQECVPTRDPPQPASIDMGPHTRNGFGPNAADDTGDVPHRQNIYVKDVPRGNSVPLERQKHIVVQTHGQTCATLTIWKRFHTARTAT